MIYLIYKLNFVQEDDGGVGSGFGEAFISEEVYPRQDIFEYYPEAKAAGLQTRGSDIDEADFGSFTGESVSPVSGG